MVDIYKIKRVEEELAKYYNLTTRKNFIASKLQGPILKKGFTGSIDDLVEAIMRLQGSGSLFGYQVIEKIKKFQAAKKGGEIAVKSAISKIVTSKTLEGDITATGIAFGNVRDAMSGGANEVSSKDPKGDDKKKKSSISFLINSGDITPASYNTNSVSLFLNTIPTLELARAMPFINIDVISPRPPITGGGQLQSLSIYRFLDGASSITDANGNATNKLADSQDPTRIDKDGKIISSSTQAGMEIFLSPQTLVNANDSGVTGKKGKGEPRIRAAEVLDKFQPFLSINRLTLEIVQAMGMYSYKSGMLELTLHDRSRLAEIADLINPDLYGHTELMIEYGWAHPDDIRMSSGKAVPDNVYADLINIMRTKEKFGVRNSSFEFQESGAVKVRLDIYLRGAAQLKSTKITHVIDSMAENKLNQINLIKLSLSQLRQRTGINNKMAEIRASQLLDASSNTSAPLITLTQDNKEQFRRIRKLLRYAGRNSGGGGSNDLKTLSKALIDLYGTSHKKLGGLVGEIQEKRGNAASDILKDINKNANPFESSKFSNKSHTTFGKIFTRFAVEPLLATNQFNEIQVMYYPLNQNAGKVRGVNVAEFPINKATFAARMKQVLKVRHSLDMSVAEFILLINNAFIDDSAADAFGLTYNSGRDLYTAEFNAQSQRIENRVRQIGKKDDRRDPGVERVSGQISRRMAEYGIEDGIFKKPNIDMIMESVPWAGDGKTSDDNPTILRIHIFDRQATPYAIESDMLKAARDDDIHDLKTKLNTVAAQQATGTKTTTSADKRYQSILSEVIESGLFTKSGDMWILKKSVEDLKDQVMSFVPSIIYGSNHTAVLSAKLSSMQIPELSTVHMLRHGVGGMTAPSGLGPGEVPLRVIPTQLEMTTVGCPLLQFGQQFFVDFSTNTTADDIYTATQLTHDILEGSFTTRMTLWPLDALGAYENLASLANKATTLANKIVEAEKGNK